MAGFKFPLESALRLRQLQVEAETAKLTELNRQLQELCKSIAATKTEQQQASTFVQQSPAIEGADLRALSSFTLGVVARMHALKEAERTMERRVFEQRLGLRKAEQNEQALSELRARRLAEWRLRLDRETEITAQELWLYSHTTKQRHR